MKDKIPKIIIFSLVALFIVTMCLAFAVTGSGSDTGLDMQAQGGIQQEDNFGRETGEIPTTPVPTVKEEIEADDKTASEATPETVKDSFLLSYEGFDTGVEIFFKDCVCEYDQNHIQVYSYYVDDPAVEPEGYAIYIQTPEEEWQIFPVKNYLVDQNAGSIYMIWNGIWDGIESFERIQGVDLVGGLVGYKVTSTYIMEELIGEAYGLELMENDEDFTDLQVEFMGLYEENGKTLLRGTASAIYNASGKRYFIQWDIDTDSTSESAKAYLTDFHIHPLYAAFLRGEISVANPYAVEGGTADLSFFDDRDYDSEFHAARKKFSLVDVNHDGNSELVFQIYDSPSELLYLLGVRGNELICFDVFETHTTHISFGVYDNGIVRWGQNYDGDEDIYYTYTNDGKVQELIHFVKEASSHSDLIYDYYYLEGNENSRFSLQSDEEYESLESSYRGEGLEWFDCESFVDIPKS